MSTRPPPEDRSGEELRAAALESVAARTRLAVQGGIESGQALVSAAEDAVRNAVSEPAALGVTLEEAAAGGVTGVVQAAVSEVGLQGAEEPVLAAVRGALTAAHEGGAELSKVIAHVVHAGLDAGRQAEFDMIDLTQSLARCVLQTTAELQADLASAARQTVAGAVSAARGLDLSTDELATAAATGVVEVAAMQGPDAAAEVHGAIAEPVEGVTAVLREPTRQETDPFEHEEPGRDRHP